MSALAPLADWLTMITRWAHIATAMAWFGAAFYFRARELRLRPAADLNETGPGTPAGAQWEFHGGGYIRAIKYRSRPEGAPQGLGLFRWESYFTWITGFLLLALVYYAEAALFLIDSHKLDLTPGQAVGLSLVSLGGGWLVYDGLCRALRAWPGRLLDGLIFALMLAASWGFYQVFAARAAMLHLGALMATVMVANVLVSVVGRGKRVQAALDQGGSPDPADRQMIRQRGRHTRYLHLPILFLMAAVHAPLVYGTAYAWLMAPLALAIGIALGKAFEAWHRDRRLLAWPWALAGLLAAAMVALSLAGAPAPADDLAADDLAASGPATFGPATFGGAGGGQGPGADPPPGSRQAALLASPDFPALAEIIASRCTMCHARAPGYTRALRSHGLVALETPEDIARQARQIYLQAGLSTAMPPGNLSFMTDAERALIQAWYRAAP